MVVSLTSAYGDLNIERRYLYAQSMPTQELAQQLHIYITNASPNKRHNSCITCNNNTKKIHGIRYASDAI